VNREALDDLKEQIPLMGYLHAQDWRPARPLSRGRWMGLCPLHGDHNPSFLVDNNKGLFYCYGCGRGGDVIRFAELYHQVKFPQAVALLRQWRGVEPVLQEAVRFYRTQLHRHSEAFVYLYERGIRSAALIEEMRIGYAPGGCLRGWLTQLGHSLPDLCQTGLVTEAGYDAYVRRIVFPLEGNLYGRSLSAAAPPHRFLPGAKGGLYLWEQVQAYPEVILVEGLFVYAAVWQAGFQDVTCSLGAHLNTRQFRQLYDAPRTVYLAFDDDPNGSGQQAAQSLAGRLREQGVNARLLQGLRSQEVLDLNRDDLLLPEAQIRVPGKGGKIPFLPLAPEAIQLLDHYLRLERPDRSSTALFVSLKGPARGARMTAAGLRSLFRHHRQTTRVKQANPHRFRHYAASRTMPRVSERGCRELLGRRVW